jgi:hypothetical protein
MRIENYSNANFAKNNSKKVVSWVAISREPTKTERMG